MYTLKKLTRIILDYILELKYIFGFIKNQENLTIEDERFISLNNQYWCDDNPDLNHSQKIIVQGFFSNSGHNYLLRTGMLAKSIQSKLGLDIVVLFDKYSHQLIGAQKKYASFGIKEFIYITPGIRSIIFYLKSVCLALICFLKIKSPNDILDISEKGILIGDLIYDDILKYSKNKTSVEDIGFDLLKKIISTLYFLNWYLYIFKRGNIKYLITTHLVYAQYGVLARAALKSGINIIETNDLAVNLIHSKTYLSKPISIYSHSVLKEKLKDALKVKDCIEDIIPFAEDILTKRFNGLVEQFDARFAYKNKEILSKDQFFEALNIEHGSFDSIVVIFSHVFSDAPHSSEKILFQDYYTWLYQTVLACSKISNTCWIVKPHPSSHVYGEGNLVLEMINDIKNETQCNNIHIFPESAKAVNLENFVSAIVTVQGTAGLEFSCLGIPVILAGKAFYAGWGFTYDPISIEDYFYHLNNIPSIPKLSDSQIDEAKKIFGAYMLLQKESKIISADALDLIWGYGPNNISNLELGNKNINDALEKHDPRNEFQYQYVYENV